MISPLVCALPLVGVVGEEVVAEGGELLVGKVVEDKAARPAARPGAGRSRRACRGFVRGVLRGRSTPVISPGPGASATGGPAASPQAPDQLFDLADAQPLGNHSLG